MILEPSSICHPRERGGHDRVMNLWTPAFGLVAKVQKERFEIAARFFKSLAMT